jgi:hypothetical protein
MKMSKTTRANNVPALRAVAVAVMSLVFAATARLPAAARDAPNAQFAQPNRHLREHVPNHRYFNYEGSIRPGFTYVPAVPPNACDLPSTGCESYLSN